MSPTNLQLLEKYLEKQISEHDRSLEAYRKAMAGVQARRDGLQASLDDLRKVNAGHPVIDGVPAKVLVP
jgi:phosphoenolpyruvate carboxylase